MLTNLIITAYCACKICCGDASHGRTASGIFPRPGRTCAASRNIEFGTKMVIDGHVYIVEDRLAKRFDNRVDIYFATHKAAQRFGKKTNTVNIVEKDKTYGKTK